MTPGRESRELYAATWDTITEALQAMCATIPAHREDAVKYRAALADVTRSGNVID